MVIKNQPRVSVILAAYNEEDCIHRAVDSILGQTFSDFELIVLDDGSVDKTWDVIESFDDPRIRKVKLDRMGFTKALNHGLSMTRGEYIARMDADDESLPERLARQVEFLDANPSISILGTTYYKYDALRNERYMRIHPEADRDIRRALGLYIPICHGSVMFKKVVVDKVGGYDEKIRDAEDLELWLRAAPHFKFANLGPPPVYIYYFDPQHSFNEATLGRLTRVLNALRLNIRAVRLLGLPAYFYFLIGAKLIYHFALTSSLKRIVRRVIAQAQELRVQSNVSGHAPGAAED